MRYTLIGLLAAGTSVCAYAQDEDFDALLDGLLEDTAIEEAAAEEELVEEAAEGDVALDEADAPAEEAVEEDALADAPAEESVMEDTVAEDAADTIEDMVAEELGDEAAEEAAVAEEDIAAEEEAVAEEAAVAEEIVPVEEDVVAEEVAVAEVAEEETAEEIAEEAIAEEEAVEEVAAEEEAVAEVPAEEPVAEVAEVEPAEEPVAEVAEVADAEPTEVIEEVVEEGPAEEVAEVGVADDSDDIIARLRGEAVATKKPAKTAPAKVAGTPATAEGGDVVEPVADDAPKGGLLADVTGDTKELDEMTAEEVAYNDLAMLNRIKNKGLENHAVACLKRAREIIMKPAPAGKAKAHYESAIKMYGDALKYFTDVQREDLADLRAECAYGIEESHYRWALALYNEGDLNASLLQAQDVNLKGHAKAQKLIAQIKEELNRPKEFRPEPVLPEYAKDEYKAERLVIMDRLQRATTYYHLAKYKEANDQLELILRDDPSNESAIDLRRRIDRRDSERKRQLKYSTHAEMIAQVEANWTPLGALGRHSEELYTPVVSKGESVKVDDDGKKEAAIINEKLNYIRMPEFSIRPPSTLADAVKILADASNDYDKPELPPEEKGISFVLNIGSNPAAASEEPASEEEDLFASEDSSSSSGLPPIQNIHMPWVTLKDALDMLCEVTGTKYIIKGKSVVIVPANYVDGKMETRSYNVMSTIVEKVGQVNSELSAGGGGSDEWSMDSGAEAASGSSDSSMWKQLFTELGVPFEGKASIVYLSSIGKLRVTNTPENLALFENVLEELNVTPYQIEVEARFVEVSQADMNSLGFEWRLNSDIVGTIGSGIDWLDSNIMGNSNYGGAAGGTGATGHVFRPGTRGGTGDANFAIHGGAEALNQGMRYLGNSSTAANRINLGNSAIAPDDTFASFSAVFGRVDMTVILHMLAQRTDTDMLSSPKVLARPGQEAMIRVVTEWIYPTEFDVTEIEESDTNYDNNSSNSVIGGGGISNISPPPVKFAVEPQSFEKQEVGVSLTVVPEVSQEGQMINLLVNPKVVEYLGDFEYGMQVPYIQYSMTGNQITGADVAYYQVSMPQPKFHFREISTYLSVYNGSTVVMGGLITETRNSFEDKVPILGDLPFIGFLFRSSGEYSEKRNLLIFLTARLVDPAGRPLKTATDGRTGTSAMDAGSANTMSSTVQ